MPQKEETFQVVIDIIKNSTCFKAFIIFVDVPKIFMQQFWYTIKKVQDTDSYEFLLANKKCTVNAKVFRKILDICPRGEGVNFTDVQDDDTTLTFLIDLGYKGPLNRHTNMFMDHMHQLWRTLAAILNKQDADDEDVATESDEDDIYKYKIHVGKDKDVEMKDVEVEGSDKGFGDQSLKLSSDSSLVSTVKDSAYADISSLLDIPIQHETPQIQSPSLQKIPISVIPETTNLPL
ncbi:hypothetical protein Tco_0710669 [Tanacetum coccineum]